jgi:hypothetical protein
VEDVEAGGSSQVALEEPQDDAINGAGQGLPSGVVVPPSLLVVCVTDDGQVYPIPLSHACSAALYNCLSNLLFCPHSWWGTPLQQNARGNSVSIPLLLFLLLFALLSQSLRIIHPEQCKSFRLSRTDSGFR